MNPWNKITLFIAALTITLVVPMRAADDATTTGTTTATTTSAGSTDASTQSKGGDTTAQKNELAFGNVTISTQPSSEVTTIGYELTAHLAARVADSVVTALAATPPDPRMCSPTIPPSIIRPSLSSIKSGQPCLRFNTKSSSQK